MKTFRITWRHEVYIRAETKEDAQSKWNYVDFGVLDEELQHGSIKGHGFVELVSIEEEAG